MKKAMRWPVLVGSTVTLTVLGITPAFAAASISTTGSTASYNSSNHRVQACDTKADGHSAYVWYRIGVGDPNAHSRVETFRGSGTCESTAVSGQSGNKVSFKACRDISGGPDNCSDWVVSDW